MAAITVQPAIIEALDARFQERRAQVPVLAQRAGAEGIDTVRAPAENDRLIEAAGAMSRDTATPPG